MLTYAHLAKRHKQLSLLWHKGTLAHALLFYGPVGAGKKTLALSLAETVLQKSTEGKVFNQNTHPHFQGIGFLPEAKTLSVEEIREGISKLFLKSHPNCYDILMICDAQRMTVNAQNSLLKTLEEPTPNSLILLTANGLSGLLPSVISRVQRIYCKMTQTRRLDTDPLREDIVSVLGDFFSNKVSIVDFAKSLEKQPVLETCSVLETLISDLIKLKFSLKKDSILNSDKWIFLKNLAHNIRLETLWSVWYALKKVRMDIQKAPFLNKNLLFSRIVLNQ